MNKDIEKVRQELYEAINKYGLQSEKTINISKKIDKYANECLKNTIKKEDNEMKKAYLDTYMELKKIKIQTGKFPKVREWNKYAQKNTFLNSESIKYINGQNWKQLKQKIESEI